jgi:hypothetical protein
MRNLATAAMLLAIAVPAPSAIAQAPPPQQVSFQGRLTDASGNPADGSFSMTFTIFDAASGGNVKWTETQTVAVSGGLYHARLGSGEAFPSDLTANLTDERWLEIQVESDPAMAPRYPLTGALYARRALAADAATTADTLDGIHAAGFAQLSASNVFSSTNTFSGTVTFNSPAAPLRLRSVAAMGTVLTTLVSDALISRTARFPDSNGTVVTTGNLADIVSVGTVKSGAWEGSPVGTAYGGTGSSEIGSAGSVAYSAGTAYAFLAPQAGGPVLHSGSHGAAPYWSAVDLASSVQTTGTLPTSRGGTGLSDPGAEGLFLKSDGSGWTSSTIQASDLPSGLYLTRNGDDTSSASFQGFLIELNNTNESGNPVGALKAVSSAYSVSGGMYYGIKAESGAGDSLSGSGDAASYGVHGSSSAASRVIGGATRSYGMAGIATGSSDMGTTLNYGVYGTAYGSHGAINHGLYGSATGSTTNFNYGVYGVARNGAVNYAGYFDGEVVVTGLLTGTSGISTDTLSASSGVTADTLTVSSGISAGTLALSGALSASPGSAAAPAYAFTGDDDTGMFRPASNELAFSTGGTERLRLPPAGGLLVTGNATVTGQFTFSSPASYALSISAAGMSFDTSRDYYTGARFSRARGALRPLHNDVAGDFAYLIADVRLPQGATVTKVTVLLFDNVDGSNNPYDTSDPNIQVEADLYAHSYTSTVPDTMTHLVANSSAIPMNEVYPLSSTTINGPVIDNRTNRYYMEYFVSWTHHLEDLRFYGVKIEYTIQSVSP